MIPAYGLDNHMVDPGRHHRSRIAQARRLHRSEGLGYVRIARQLELSPWTVRNWLRGITRK